MARFARKRTLHPFAFSIGLALWGPSHHMPAGDDAAQNFTSARKDVHTCAVLLVGCVSQRRLPLLPRSASSVDEVLEELSREPDPNVRRSQRGDPPPETGRNPQAVAEDLVSGALAIPGAFIAFVFLFVLAGYLRVAFLPPPQVPLRDALAALISIEDDFYATGPSMGVRQRITNWFQWSQLDRRLDVELEGLPEPTRNRASELGRNAVEFLASVVEYSGYSNGIGDAQETGRMADKVAAQQAQEGRTEYEDFAGKALSAGRQALADSLRSIDDARLELEGDE